MTLLETLEQGRNRNRKPVAAYLSKAEINDWNDCTAERLYQFAQLLKASVSQNSAAQYIAVLRAILNRNADRVPCKNVREILRVRTQASQKVYLTADEIERLGAVRTRNGRERFVLNCFIVSCKTGCRVSDTLRLDASNLTNGGTLTYVSQKTRIEASIPVSERTVERIRQANESNDRPTLSNYELIIRRLCKRACINETVKVFKAGKEMTGEKWQFVSSHTARVSFVSNLLALNVPLLTVSKLCGHANTAQTERYNACRTVEIPSEGLAYLR